MSTVAQTKTKKPTTVQEFDALLSFLQTTYKFDLTNTKDITMQKLVPSKSTFSAKSIKKALKAEKKTEEVADEDEEDEVSEEEDSVDEVTKTKTKRGPSIYNKWVKEYKSIHGNTPKKDLNAKWAALSDEVKKSYKDKDMSGIEVPKKEVVKKNANHPDYIFSEAAKRWIPRSGAKGKELVLKEQQQQAKENGTEEPTVEKVADADVDDAKTEDGSDEE